MATGEGAGEPSPGGGGYALDNAAERQARARFAALAAQFDPGTCRHLAALGVGPGWRCLEVGAGGGSVAAWLCERVGPSGRVLATDLDPRFIRALGHPNLEVRRHDVARDPLPAGAFDLVHERLTLVHVPERERALGRLVAALRPGGWLLMEEFEHLPPKPGVNTAEQRLALWEAFERVLVAHGVDLEYGRRLPGLLRDRGLEAVDGEGRSVFWRGGSAGGSLLQANFEQVRSEVLDAGVLTEDAFERDLARVDAPDFLMPSPLMWAVWGRRR